MNKLAEISKALADLNEDETLKLVKEALKSQVAPEEILKACQEGMNEVGSRFEKEEYFISDLMMSGEIFKNVGAVLGPLLKAGSSESSGKVVLGTVKGDIHDIGKDIVVNMLKAGGFEVLDLGVDVPPAQFVEALKESKAKVLGLSGLLTLAFDSMRETIDAVTAAGLRNSVKVMVGGSPVDGNVCKAVGADDWGANAQQAVKLAKQWYQTAAG